MDVKTQQITIITLGIIALTALIITGTDRLPELVIAGLIGFLGQKTLTEKQSETIEKTIMEGEEDDVQ